ncbi:MAG: hypothetical protein WCK91_00205 [bacterium]
MDKQQILALIEWQLATGKISKDDLRLILNDTVAQAPVTTPTQNTSMPIPPKEEHSKNLVGTFYAIGAIIALVGVGILVGQNWVEIGVAGRILVTLGISLVTYISALLLKKPEQRSISQVMFVMSAALAPLGVSTLLGEANINFVWPYTLYTALMLCIIFLYALWVTKKNLLILIAIGFGSWAYYIVLMNAISFEYSSDLLKWAFMLLGFSYIAIAYGYKSVSGNIADQTEINERAAVANVLVGFGALAILGTGIFIGGIFDLFYIGIIFAAFYGSVYMKSRMMLTLGALFLMAHIIKLTSKYFVDSIGWPVALIVVGFLIIGVGYGTLSLNKKYIAGK